MKNSMTLSVLLSLFVMVLFFTGCESDFWDKTNDLTIENYTESYIIFQFRGESHNIISGGTKKLSGADLPNGTYPYSSVVQVLYDEMTLGEGIAGEMEFNRGTEIVLTYTSLKETDSSKTTYSVDAVLNTSNNLEQ